MPNPTVHIIATGGSIAGVGPDRMDYTLYPEIGDHLTIEQNLARAARDRRQLQHHRRGHGQRRQHRHRPRQLDRPG